MGFNPARGRHGVTSDRIDYSDRWLGTLLSMAQASGKQTSSMDHRFDLQPVSSNAGQAEEDSEDSEQGDHEQYLTEMIQHSYKKFKLGKIDTEEKKKRRNVEKTPE